MEKFVADCLSLLAVEREAELRESEALLSKHLESPRELESRGVCIQKLQVSTLRVGLYGRQVVAFEVAPRSRASRESRALPTNSISSGDIVGLFVGGRSLSEQRLSGVVTRCSDASVSVAFDDLPDSVELSSHNGQLQIVRLANDVTYHRTRRGLEELGSGRACPARPLVEVLFAGSPLGPPDPRLLGELNQEELSFSFFNPLLDHSQCRAVLAALARPDIAIIHGPPGTGKTTTVVELILQAVARRQKVLACAPSNIAVDNLVERLARAGAKVIRIGHPARLVESVLRHSLDALLSTDDSAQIVRDVRCDIEKTLVQVAKSRNSAEKRKWRNEVRTLRKELRQREQKALKELLSRADVILSTLTGASLEGPLKHLPDDHFNMVVIDECAQAVEAACWIPLLRSPKCVLAGDHNQLPPTIMSQEAASKGLSVTLMERLVGLYGNQITSLLTVQYRMNRLIMEYPSSSLYDSQLTAHSSVANHLLKDLDGVGESRETCVAMVMVDTAGCGLTELDTPNEESKGNEGEADLVVHHVKALTSAGVQLKDMAVIAPYNLQVELIRRRLPSLGADYRLLEVRSVDGFQGREKEAVIISLTRSNKKGEVGFLSEQRRMNVAMTRARRHLALIGDSDTVCNEPFIKGLVDYCLKEGEVWSAREYLDDVTFEESHHYKEKPTKPKQSLQRKGDEEARDRGPANARKKPAKDRSSGGVFTMTSATRVSEGVGKKGSSGAGAATSTVTESDVEEMKEKLQEQLQKFLEKEGEGVMSFPPSLSGHERKIVHELCEELSLHHISKGQGRERFIEVRKTVDKEGRLDSQQLDVSPQFTDEPEQKAAPEVEVEKGVLACPVCGVHVPSANFELHAVKCERNEKLKSYELSAERPKQKSKPKKKSAKRPPNEPKDEDLDTLLAEMALSDTTCGLPACKKTVNLVGVQCQFCKRRFCMAHNIPEVHGCSEASKKHSKLQIGKELRGASKPRSLGAVRRTQLQTKLDKKIDDLSASRKVKKSSK